MKILSHQLREPQAIQFIDLVYSDELIENLRDKDFTKKEGALVDTRQEARLPVLGILDRHSTRAHRDEAGQVLVFAAEAVERPCAHARSRLSGVATVHQHQ